MSTKSLTLVLSLIVLAALSRLLPHPPNFSPLGAMALFGAAVIGSRRLAIVLPFAALYLSDLLLNNLVYGQYYEGFYAGFNVSVYVSFGLILLLGFGLLRGRKLGWRRVGGTTLAATLLFFLVTNFGSWLSLGMYPKTFGGLLSAYAAGLPFLQNSLAGNLVFATLLFGAYGWVTARAGERATA